MRRVGSGVGMSLPRWHNREFIEMKPNEINAQNRIVAGAWSLNNYPADSRGNFIYDHCGGICFVLFVGKFGIAARSLHGNCRHHRRFLTRLNILSSWKLFALLKKNIVEKRVIMPMCAFIILFQLVFLFKNEEFLFKKKNCCDKRFARLPWQPLAVARWSAI